MRQKKIFIPLLYRHWLGAHALLNNPNEAHWVTPAPPKINKDTKAEEELWENGNCLGGGRGCECDPNTV